MIIFAYFTDGGTPATGLSPTITIWGMNGEELVSLASMIEIGGGFYKYNYGTYDSGKDYVFRADGGATLSGEDRYVFSSNEFDAGGGGFAPTQDMVMDLKRLADNMPLKKDMEKFFEKITGVSVEKDESTEKNISKMGEQISERLDVLSNENANKELKRELSVVSNSIKSGFRSVSSYLDNKNTDFNQLIEMNDELIKKISKDKEEFDIVKKELDSYKKSIDQIDKNINETNKGNKELLTKKDVKFNQLVKTNDELIKKISKDKEEFSSIKKKLDSYKEDIGMIKTAGSKNKELFVGLSKTVGETSKRNEELFTDLSTNLNKSEGKLSDTLSNISKEVVEINKESVSKFEEENKQKEGNIKSNFDKINNKFDLLVKKVSNREKELHDMLSEKEEIKVESDKNYLNSLNKLAKEINEIKEANGRLVNKRDMNFLSVEIDKKIRKLNQKLIEMNNQFKNKLITISKKSRKDDLNDVMSQMDLLKNE